MTDVSVRERLLQAVWEMIRGTNETNVLNYPAARRAIESGASASDLARAMNCSAYEMAFGLLFLLSAEHVEEDVEGAQTGWTIVECSLTDSDEPTSDAASDLESLHEDLLTADPTGLEGQDLFA